MLAPDERGMMAISVAEEDILGELSDKTNLKSLMVS